MAGGALNGKWSGPLESERGPKGCPARRIFHYDQAGDGAGPGYSACALSSEVPPRPDNQQVRFGLEAAWIIRNVEAGWILVVVIAVHEVAFDFQIPKPE